MRLILVAVCAALGMAVSTAGAADSNVVSIEMRQQSFIPEKAVVKPGSTVMWTNGDTIPHSVTANDGSFDSGSILPGQSFKWVANANGDVAYHCIYHPSMTATLTLQQK